MTSIIFSYITGSSQSGIGGSNSVYCGGFLNDFPAATTDAKIRGYFYEVFSKCATLTVKFIYSEKATQFCEIFTSLLTGTT